MLLIIYFIRDRGLVEYYSTTGNSGDYHVIKKITAR